MGYQVQKHGKSWRVFWRKYEKDPNTSEYKAKYRHIPSNEYKQIGIAQGMTLNQVKDLLKKKNLEDEKERREEKRNTIAAKISEEKDIECTHLPKTFVDKFEQVHLATRYIENDARLKKVLKLWRTAQRIIRAVQIPIDQWHRYPEHFYAHFVKRCVSPGYTKNILSTINNWIDFLGYEQQKSYRLLPAPNNVWQSKINTAFEEADKSKASLPITPTMLENAKPPFSEAQYNWIYCTVWAGLRPNEATSLLNKKRTKISFVNDTPILGIYQSKLKNIPKIEDRWKQVPLFLPEQKKILQIIESGNIEEPLSKTIASRFGEGHSLYGGRKGFHDLMVTQYQQPELEVVRWLGHKSLDMAMKHYAKKDAVRWIPIKKEA